jgi:hypothetical protein
MRILQPLVALALLGLFAFGPAPALAQAVVTPNQVAIACAYNASPPTVATGNYVLVQCDSTGKLSIASTVTGTVSLTGASGTPTQSTVSVLNTSTTVLAAATATTFIKLCVAQTAANGVWVNWAGAAALTAAPSEYIPPGQCDSWVKSTGFLPTSQINAIASATTAVTLIYN